MITTKKAKIKVMTSEVFNENNMDVMSRYPDKYFNLAIVDPPYYSGPEKRKFYGSEFSKHGVKRIDYEPKQENKFNQYKSQLKIF